MSTGEDEASSRNGRLRPRKSGNTCIASPHIRPSRNTDIKRATDRPKRSSTSFKALPSKHDDFAPICDVATAALFLCSYCDKKFNTRQAASKHSRRIHLSSSKQDNFFKCLFCNYSDAESNAIIKHMVDNHPNQYFACLECYTRFSSTSELADHKSKACDKQNLPYRSKLRQKTSTRIRKSLKNTKKAEKVEESNENKQYTEDISFNGIVISCELKPSETNEAADIEDKITTNLILPSGKTSLANTGLDKKAVIILDDLQWNKRLPPNFSFHNTDADQILSRLGVVHRSPRVGETRKDLIRLMDEPNEKFEKCFDTTFYTKVAKNVQENLAKYVDGTFNFNPNKDSSIKTRKAKASVMINTAEGFPILLVQEQFTRHLFDGFMPRAIAPKHKCKWDSENDKSLMMLLDQTKRDSHANNCIITLISSLDIWTQLRMRSKFEEIYKTTTAKKTQKQHKIGMELKEILESRDIPSQTSQVVQFKKTPVDSKADLELPSYLGLSPSRVECQLQPAVLSGEWVRPRCYVCCACGEQTRDGRTLTAHLASQHPNAQVQHYEIVGETLLSADILKHLYVPPSQMSNRTRPPRGFRDCTKCKKSITLEDLHQHMLDCAGDTPTVRRKCRYRPFGVRRRRPRMPENIMPKKMRKDLRARHRQKSHLRPRIRSEVGDAETIRKMIADLPEKRNRIRETPAIVVRPRRTILKSKKLRVPDNKKQGPRKCTNKPNTATTSEIERKHDTDNSSTIDEDDQPLKSSATRVTRSGNRKQAIRRRIISKRNKQGKHLTHKRESDKQWYQHNYTTYPSNVFGNDLNMYQQNSFQHGDMPLYDTSRNNIIHPEPIRPGVYRPPYFYPNPQNPGLVGYDPRIVSEIQMRNVRVEQFDQPKYENQTALQFPNERIDVTNPGPTYMRQHSGRNDNNNQRSDHSGADGFSEQNSNMSDVPNLPLKHSIARLTSDTGDRGDSSTPYYSHYTLPPIPHKSFIHQSDERKAFENESIVEEVDKPPLQRNLSLEERAALNILIASDKDYRQQYPYPYGAAEPALQHEPKQFRANAQQMIFPDEPAEIDVSNSTDPPLLNDFEGGQENVEDLSMQRSSKEIYKNPDTKLEIEKSKSNKTRKVLNIENCIAMIRTKKGLPFDKSVCEAEEPKNSDGEIKSTEIKSTEETTMSSSKLERPLADTTTAQICTDTKSDDMNKTSNEQCVGSSKSAEINQSLIANDSTSITENTLPKNDVYLSERQNDTHVLSITQSTKDLESRNSKNSTLDQSNQKNKSETIYEASESPHEFWLHLSNLSSFWHSLNTSKNYSIAANKAILMLKDLNIPCLTNALTALQRKHIKLNNEVSLPMLYNYSFQKLYLSYNKNIPDDNTLMQDCAKAHTYLLKLPKSVNLSGPGTVTLPTDSTENVIEEKISQSANDSQIPRKTRRKPQLSKELNTRQNAMIPLDSHTSKYMTRHLGPAPVSTASDTLHLQSLPPPTPTPPYLSRSVRKRRDSYNQIPSNLNSIKEPKESTHISPSDIHAEKIYQQLMRNNAFRNYDLSYGQRQKMTNYNTYAAESFLDYEKLLSKFHLGSDSFHKIGSVSSDYSSFEQTDKVKRQQINQSMARAKRGSDNIIHESAKQRSDKLASSEVSQLRPCDDIGENAARHDALTSASNLLNSDPRRLPLRRSSEVFCPRSSEHDATVLDKDLLKTSDCSIDLGSNENIDKLDHSPRMYQEPVAPFSPQSVEHTNRSQTREITKPSPVHEEAPLDLSCVSRTEKSSDTDLLPSDLSINMCMREKTGEDYMSIPNTRINFEPLHTPQHNLMPEYTSRLGSDDNAYQQTPTKQFERSENSCLKNYHEVTNQYNTDPCTIYSRTTDNDSSINAGKANKELHAGNSNISLSKHTHYLSGVDNYHKPCELQAPLATDFQKTCLLENNKDLMQPISEIDTDAKFDINTNLDTSKKCHQHLDHHLASENVPTSNDSTQDLHHDDKNQNDQDDEVARKIAMLPQELVKVLGTIPTNHRNQLLNILPQYVTASVSNVENDANKLTSSVNNPSTSLSEREDSARLTVNTAISPSSVIPKKRHSPLQTRRVTNSGESQSTAPLMLPPIAPNNSQHSPIGNYEGHNSGTVTSNYLVKNTENYGNDCSGVPIIPVTPTQFSPPQLPTKHKASNEQTASLRAVRIKTTASRKSFCDEKRLLANYTYKTNPRSEEITTIPSFELQDKTKSSDINNDLENMNETLKNTDQYPIKEVTRDAGSVQDLDDMLQNKSNIIEKEDVSTNIKHKTNDIVMLNSTSDTSPLFSVIADTQGKSNINNNFASQNTDTSSVDNQSQESGTFYVKPLIVPSNCEEIKKELTAQNQSPSVNQNTSTNTQLENILNKSDIAGNVSRNSDYEMPVFSNISDAKNGTTSEDQINKTLIDNPQIIKDSQAILDKYKFIEEDSEDDITLAIIKQKHRPMPVDVILDTKAQGGKKPTAKQSESKEKSKKIHKKAAKQHKKKSKYGKNTKDNADSTASKEIAQDKINDVVSNLTEINEDGKSKETAESPFKQSGIDIIQVKVCDVNKEITTTDSMQMIPENENRTDLVTELNNKIENNSLQKNNLSDEHIKGTVEQIQRETNLNVSFSANIANLDDKQNIEVKREEQAKLCDSLKNPIQNYNCDELPEVSPKEKETTLFTDLVKSTHDIQMCSEISEVNVLPLRRSRRGKSMYIDSTNLKDSQKNNEPTPLTMKRLILSRVEKDKKRMSESSVVENSNEPIDSLISNVILPTQQDEPIIIPTFKKGKVTKRKKSPHLSKKAKKNKQNITCQLDDNLDLNNIQSENDSLILRELPNAENKPSINESCIEDGKSHSTSDITKNTSTGKDFDILSEAHDTSASPKPNINMSKESEYKSSKSKNRIKSQYDFDSDDDKVLLDSKQCTVKTTVKRNMIPNQDVALEKIEKYPAQDTTNDLNEISDDQIINASVPAETRTTCYSRPISNKKPRSSAASSRNSANYDPYNIDFEDMVEISKPRAKKRSKNTMTAKLPIERDAVKSEDLHNLNLTSPATMQIKYNIEVHVEQSDSDSSKSDVPLQKYLDENVLELELKDRSNNCLDTKQGKVLEDANEIDKTPEEIDRKEDEHLNVNVIETSPTLHESPKAGKQVSANKSCESEIQTKDEDSNSLVVEQNKQKQSTKQKKIRRMPTISSDDTASAPNEDDQKMRSDKFMENFGFYSERIPRKSNLLATKKISETFHIISDETEDCFSGYKEKSRKNTTIENKKKIEVGCDAPSEGSTIGASESKTLTVICESKVLDPQSTEPKTVKDDKETIFSDEPDYTQRMDDSDLDSLTAQAIMNSEEVRNLENDLFSGLREAAKANAARNSYICYQSTNDLDATKHDEQNEPVVGSEDCQKGGISTESSKKLAKNKPDGQSCPKPMMYPDIEEIDMFEDKFDKIKRKRRSQAVAAKQQMTFETSNSSKSRKQSEKKRIAKTTKKNYQSGQVPTKGALKGFECIKISIPTQDLNLPANVSPPRQNKKRRKTAAKRRKESSYSESSGVEFGDGDKFVSDKDIYEFQDSEDAELLDLRPSTVMDRFRSMHIKNKYEFQETEDAELFDFRPSTVMDRFRSMHIKNKCEFRDSEDAELFDFRPSTVMDRFRSMHIKNKSKHKDKEKDKEEKIRLRRRDKRKKDGTRTKRNRESIKKNVPEKHISTNDHSLKAPICVGPKSQKYDRPQNHSDDHNKKGSDNAVAGTSGFVPDRMDESDYESELSSPEGDFIFYTSNDVNCTCPSENESDESDNERGCGRLNCLNKNKNADKNTAIGNIFKNNAVRCEKPEIKEPDIPKPDLDQLFDSLLETESKPNDTSFSKNDSSAPDKTEQLKTPVPLDIPHDPMKSKIEDHTPVSNNDTEANFDEEGSNPKNDHQATQSCRKNESDNMQIDERILNLFLSDSDSNPIAHKPKENDGSSKLSKKCPQSNITNINSHDNTNKQSKLRTTTIKDPSSGSVPFSYLEHPEWYIENRSGFPELVLPTEKASTCAHVDSKLEDSEAESGNEPAANKHLKGMTASEAANMEIYTMGLGQGTQTDSSNKYDGSSKHTEYSNAKSVDELNSNIQLQKHDVREISKKSKTTRNLQTEKHKSCKYMNYDQRSDGHKEERPIHRERVVKKIESSKIDAKPETISKNVSNEQDVVSAMDDVVVFTGSSLKSPTLNYLSKKSDVLITRSNTLEKATNETEIAMQRASKIDDNQSSLKTTDLKYSPRKSDESSLSTDTWLQVIENEAMKNTTKIYDTPSTSKAASLIHLPRKSVVSNSSKEALQQLIGDPGVAKQRARRKCTVGKQNVLAEHWSSESEIEAGDSRPSSGASTEARGPRRKRSRKREGGRRPGRGSRRAEAAEPARAPPGPKIRARAPHHYWSSEGEEAAGGSQPQHGWIVGNSHKKLVTMLAHAKGRKRSHADRHAD